MTDDLPIVWDSVPLELVGMPSTSNVDPSKFPNEIFELYSVPSYANNKPEIVTGAEIRSTKQSVEIGDVLLCKIAPHLNRVWIVRELHNYRRIASSEWIVIRSKIATSDYLRYALTEPKFRSAFMATSSGVGGSLIRARPRAVAKILIPLPPINEQRRIVEKLDRIFDRLRRVRDELSHIKKLIDRYKQAVLTAACSSENYENGEIVDIQSVAHVGTGSTPLKSNSSYYADIGIPWIISAATNQPFVTEASEFVTEYAISECRLKKYPIGTLLVAMYGEGKTRGQVTELAIEATINQACAAIIVNESLACKEYVKLALQANYFEMRQLAEGGNQPNLNLSKIRNFLIFLPPLEEQKEIVRRIEERFGKIDKLEQEYQKAVKLCDRLEQETLAKAFRGELVPQDPNDEPASVLLERIRAERAMLTQPRKKSPLRK